MNNMQLVAFVVTNIIGLHFRRAFSSACWIICSSDGSWKLWPWVKVDELDQEPQVKKLDESLQTLTGTSPSAQQAASVDTRHVINSVI